MLVVTMMTLALAILPLTATTADPVAEAGPDIQDYTGRPVVFEGFGTPDPALRIILYEWDFDGDGIRETTLGVPGDPLFVDFLAGPRWVPSLDETTGVSTMKDGRTWRSYLLVPAQASDNVARVDPRDGSIERRWD